MTTPSIRAWLELEGLGEYAEAFEAQRIDVSLLATLTDADLRELGVLPLGHRKRLIAAIAALGQPAATPPPAAAMLDPLIAGFPTPLALPLRDYQQEATRYPVLKLWAACDAVEILLRVLVILGIGDLSRRGELPEQLRRELRYPIENPMLGNWRRMAQQIAEALPDDTALPELTPLVRDTLVPFLDGPERRSPVERSFLALRNRLAHGGGISRRLAAELLANWQGPFEALWPFMTWLTEMSFVVRSDAGYRRLRGPSETPEPFTPTVLEPLAAAFAASDGVVALRGDRAIPLWPLALFGIPQHPERGPDPVGQPLPQVYVRRGEVNLEYTPLGGAALPQSTSDETAVERFLVLFQAPAIALTKAQKGFTVPGFEESFGGLAKNLRGRTAERETLRAVLAQLSSGILWLDGPAGMGKSYLMADLAHELLAHSRDDTLVLGYQFKASDQRCGREPFLRFAIERLQAWLRPAEEEQEDEKPKDPDRFKALLARLGERRVLFLLDGLDEIAERDPRFAADLPLGIQGPTLTWLCAGRPERGLPEAFAAAGALRVFPDGLPPMHAGDIRTLLLERIGPLRKKLLSQDTEDGERVANAFVDKVARWSEGLPLYVRYVIEDIHAGRYRVLDAGEALPRGLHAYHEELLRRLSIGSLHQVLTPIAATLAVATEPLAAPALADLLRRRGRLVPEGEAGLRLVQKGLGAIASMLRRAPTPEGEDGFTLYHHSLAQHMAESEHCRVAVTTAREFLADLADAIPEGPLAPYLFRRGIAHLLETDHAQAALGLLTRFDYLIARLETLRGLEGVKGIGMDWRSLLAQHEITQETAVWEEFWRTREHFLLMGEENWPSTKILLQLAEDHAELSPITRAAEAWQKRRPPYPHCRLSSHDIPRQIPVNPCLFSLPGHRAMVNACVVSADGTRALSAGGLTKFKGYDFTVRLWDLEARECLWVLSGHSSDVTTLDMSRDARFGISGSLDGTLRIWDLHSGEHRTLHCGAEIHTLALLPDGERCLSGDASGCIRIWNLGTGAVERTLTSRQEAAITSSKVFLHQEAAITGSADGLLALWDLSTGRCRWSQYAHEGALLCIAISADGFRVFSGGIDARVVEWDSDTGRLLREWQEGPDAIAALALMPGGRYLLVGRGFTPDRPCVLDSSIQVLDTSIGRCAARLHGHAAAVTCLGVDATGSRILSGGEDWILRCWDSSVLGNGQVSSLPEFYVWSLAALPDGKLGVSGTDEGVVRIWDLRSRVCASVLEGHKVPVNGVDLTRDTKFIVSGGDDLKVRVWDRGNRRLLHVCDGHKEIIDNVKVSLDCRFAVSSAWESRNQNNEPEEVSLRIWSLQRGRCWRNIPSTSTRVNNLKIRLAPDGRTVVWLDMFDSAGLWNLRSSKLLWTLSSPASGEVLDVALSPDGRWCVSGDEYGTIRRWRVGHSEPQWIVKGHRDPVRAVGFSADGRLLFTGGDDASLRIWDAMNGELIATEYVRGQLITAISVLGPTYDCWLGMSNGEMPVVELLHGPNPASPQVTAVRLWRHHPRRLAQYSPLGTAIPGNWDYSFTVSCPWCGGQPTVPVSVLEAIHSLTSDVTRDQSPSLELADDAWEDPSLQSECASCHRPLRYNPFMVDNRDWNLDA